MIKKLLVLNGTEGHKFEVGKQYVNSDDVQVIDKIFPTEEGFTVMFKSENYVQILTQNVLVFYS